MFTKLITVKVSANCCIDRSYSYDADSGILTDEITNEEILVGSDFFNLDTTMNKLGAGQFVTKSFKVSRSLID